MLQTNATCFVSVPNPQNKRQLIDATVQKIDGETLTIICQDMVDLPAGSEITLFGEIRGKFHQQAATILQIVKPTDEKPSMVVQRVGEPVNCETRGCYRVSVVSQNIPLTVNKQPNCTLADISPEGMGVVTKSPLTLGTSVDIDLSIDGVFARGSLRVQTEKKLTNGSLRYGLLAPEKKSPIRRSLEALSAMMQRRQLQRLSRAA